MDIRLPSDGLLAYSRAQAWQEAPLRPQQSGQQSLPPETGGSAGEPTAVGKVNECRTCKSRKYQDGSNDSTVSFQTPTSLTPQAAETAVRSHEQEHVAHEQVNAKSEGRRVVAQQVAIHYAICPECGRAYVSGGTTTTVTKPADNAGYGKSLKAVARVGVVLDARV